MRRLTQILLSTIALLSFSHSEAQTESCIDHTTSGVQYIKIPGITDTDIIVKSLWERQLLNTDYDQNHHSIALDGDYIYVSTVYDSSADIDGRYNNLFLRRYSKASGDEQSIKIPCADYDFSNSYPVIFNDSNKNLFWGYARKVNNSIKFVYARINLEQFSYDTPTELDLGITPNTGSHPHVDAVLSCEGDATASDYKITFNLANGTFANGTTFHYLCTIENGKVSKTAIDPNNKSGFGPSTNPRPAIALYPTDSNYYIQTIIGATKPQLRTIDGQLIGELSEGLEPENCRGVYAFTHSDQPIFVLPQSYSTTSGSRFSLFSMPSLDNLNDVNVICTLPKEPFKVAEKPYLYIKQLAISEKYPFHTSGTYSRVAQNDPNNELSILYLYSPSAGIGAYAIGKSDLVTSIDNIHPDTAPSFRKVGNTIYLTESGSDKCAIYTIDGKLIRMLPVNNNQCILPENLKGIFILKTASSIFKLSL